MLTTIIITITILQFIHTKYSLFICTVDFLRSSVLKLFSPHFWDLINLVVLHFSKASQEQLETVWSYLNIKHLVDGINYFRVYIYNRMDQYVETWNNQPNI